jgi:hypothetical protein
MNIGEQPEDAKTGSAAAQEVLFEHLAAPPVMIVPCFNRPSSANRVRLAPSRPQSTPFVGGGARPAHVPAHGNFGANSNYGDFAAVRRRVEQHISAVDQTAAPDIVVTEIPAVASPAAPPGRRPLPRQAAARFPARPPPASPPGRRPLRIAYLNELGKDPGPSVEPSFRKSPFRLSVGDVYLHQNSIHIEPELFFNHFFKGVTPGLRLSIGGF